MYLEETPTGPNLQMVIQPFAEPVSLEEMKLHLKQDDIDDDDDIIKAVIVAARDVIETETGRNMPRNTVLMATTFDLFLPGFPCENFIAVPRVPLVSVTSISYVDTDGNTQTLSTSVYEINTAAGRIDLAYAQVWPNTLSRPHAVTIRFVAGVAVSITAVASSATLTPAGRAFVNGERVRLYNSGGGLPSGFSALTDYFVVNATSTNFQLSATVGGSAITAGSTGAGGTHFAVADQTKFETLRAAIKLLVADWYKNREATTEKPLKTLPFGVDTLINSQLA